MSKSAKASAGYAPAASLKPTRVALRLPTRRPSIRGVRPRGLIEANSLASWLTRSGGASAGYAPAASLKLERDPGRRHRHRSASAGYAPAASLKLGRWGPEYACQ